MSCPELKPLDPDDAPPSACFLGYSVSRSVRAGSWGFASVTTPQDDPYCVVTGITVPIGPKGVGSIDGGPLQYGNPTFRQQEPKTGGTHTVAFRPHPDDVGACPVPASVNFNAAGGLGAQIVASLYLLPEIKIESDELERAKKKVPCPVQELLDGLGFTGLDGCAVQRFLEQLMADPLGFGFLGGVLLSYLSDLFEFPPASMGWGWQMNLFQRVEELENGDLVYHDGTGSFERWTQNESDGSYQPAHRNNYVRIERYVHPSSPPPAPETLPVQTRWCYKMTFQDHTVLEFDYPKFRGRILRKIDPHIGNQTGLADEAANKLFFNYEDDRGGRLNSLQDGLGRTLYIPHDQHPDGQPTGLEQRFGGTPDHPDEVKRVDFDYDSQRRLSAIVGPYTIVNIAPPDGEEPPTPEQARNLAEKVEFTYHDASAGAGAGRLKDVIGSTGTVLVRFDYYPDGANAGKVRTERFHLPNRYSEVCQRLNEYTYDTEMRRVTIQVKDLGEYEPRNIVRTYLVNYDERFNVTRTEDPLGNVTVYEYGDARDPYLVTRVSASGASDPAPRTTAFTYNQEGLVTSVQDAQSNLTRMEYFGLEIPASHALEQNQLAWVHRPERVTVYTEGKRREEAYKPPPVGFRYDRSGNLHRLVQYVPNGDAPDALVEITTTLERNGRGQVEAIIDADGRRTSFSYNDKGNLETIRTPASRDYTEGLTTTLLYHPQRFDRVTGVQYPWGTPWSYGYDDQERLTQATVAAGEYAGFHTRFLYQNGLLTDVLAPPNKRSEPEALTAPRGVDSGSEAYRRTHYVYDLASRLEKVFSDVPLDEGSSEIQRMMDKLRVRFRHDGLGHLREMVRRIRIDGSDRDQVTTYEYDSLSRLVESADPRASADPAVKPSRMIPSAFCNELKYLSAQGRETTVRRDTLCRLASVSYSNDGDTAFEYDKLHRLIRVQQPGGTPAKYGTGQYGLSRYSDLSSEMEERTYEYDTLDRLVRVNFPGEMSIRYGYSPGGRLTSVMDVHERETRYEYHEDGRLFQVQHGDARFEYRHDEFGRLKCLVYPPSTRIVAHYTWTPRGELESIDYRHASEPSQECVLTGTSLRRLIYEYDAAGNRVNIVDSADDGRLVTTWEYWYDALNRLEWVCQDGRPVRRYRFDQSDNRSELQFFENGVPKETHVYRYELGDRLTRVSLGPEALFQFEYDDDGNTLLREEVGKRTDVYTWTDAGALKSIWTSVPGQPVAVMRNEYDAGRIRKRKLADDLTQTDYYYSGLPALSETLSPLEGEPSKRSYVVGHQVLGYFEGDSFRLFLPDALGSVRELVGSDGSVHARYTYDEYGNEIAQATAFFSGALGVKEEQNLNYMRQRWNDPTHGRFLSKDPLSTLDRYGFANNNPILYVDPTGLAGEEAGIWEPPIIPDKLNKQPFQNRRDKAASRLEWAIRLVELYAKRHGGRYADEAAAVRSYSKSPVSNILLPIKEFGEGPKDAVTWRFGRCMEFSGRLTVPDIDETHPSLRNFDADDLRFLASTVVHEGHHAVNPNATEDLAAWVGNEALSRFNEFTSSLTKEDWDLIYRGVGPITTSIGPDPLSQ